MIWEISGMKFFDPKKSRVLPLTKSYFMDSPFKGESLETESFEI
jgi:hypothetical protein